MGVFNYFKFFYDLLWCNKKTPGGVFFVWLNNIGYLIIPAFLRVAKAPFFAIVLIAFVEIVRLKVLSSSGTKTLFF